MNPREDISAWLDGELSAADAQRVAELVESDPEWEDEARRARAGRDAVRALRPAHAPLRRSFPNIRLELVAAAIAVLAVAAVQWPRGTVPSPPSASPAALRIVAHPSASAGAGTTAPTAPDPPVVRRAPVLEGTAEAEPAPAPVAVPELPAWRWTPEVSAEAWVIQRIVGRLGGRVEGTVDAAALGSGGPQRLVIELPSEQLGAFVRALADEGELTQGDMDDLVGAGPVRFELAVLPP